MGGRTIAEAFTSTAVDMSNERQQTDFNTHLSQNTMVGLMVLLCALISIMGLVLVIPWHRIWRSREEYMADRLANTGLKKKAIEAISSQVYRKLGSEESPAECPICLAEFVEGERVRVLPKCKHSFHLECVDKWLLSHSSCPTCRNCLLKKEAHDYIQSGTNRSVACVDVPRPAADGGHRISSDIECGVSPLILSVSLC